MLYENKEKNIRIVAKDIHIGKSVTFGNNINIKLKGNFSIGDYSRLGHNSAILGNNVSIGKHFYHSSGFRVGGGGRQHPNANLSIGDRCTMHNNFINVCEPVVIGNDVGLSPETSILTHGYWQSVLEGYPAAFAGVSIGNGVIIGYRSLVMMGVRIIDDCVIGAQSVITKSLKEKGIYAGSPAKFIKEIVPPSDKKKVELVEHIISEYMKIAEYHDLRPRISLNYPIIKINGFTVNVETFEYDGDENEISDDFRDYIRKWGIRIYTHRGFKSHFTFK